LAHLLGHRAEDRRVAGVEAGDVVSVGVGGGEFRDDLVEGERGGVDLARAEWAVVEEFVRDERTGVEADRCGGDQVAAADRDQIGGARTGSDEVHGHLVTLQIVTGIAGRQPVMVPTGDAR
jgi:hypothetical protein